MATMSESLQQHFNSDAGEQARRRYTVTGAASGAGSSYEDALSDNISLRPSWGRAVMRPGAATVLPTSNGQPEPQQQQPTTTAAKSAGQERPASAMADKPSAADAGHPGVGGSLVPKTASAPPGAAAPAAAEMDWFQSGPATPALGFLSATAAAPASKPVSGVSFRDGSDIAQQLFGTPSLLQSMTSTGGRNCTSTGAAAAPHGLPPGSPIGSGRASPAGGGAAAGATSDGGSGGSFLSCSPDASPTALGAPPMSPFRCRTSINSGSLASTPGLRKPEPLLGRDMSHGSHGSAGGGAGGGSAVGLGPGQVYLVVDPSTGLVVGTAQATGASSPGSLAPSTPGATGMSFHSPAGGGHTPVGTGSARSSLDLPGTPPAGSGPSGSGPGLASQLRPTSSNIANANPQLRPAGSQGPMAAADMTRAALSLLGAGGGGGAGGAEPPSSAAAVAAAAAASAAAVSQHNALALANLAAAVDSATGRASGGGAAGAGGDGGAASVQAQPSTAELFMLLASAGAGAGAPPPTSASGGGPVGPDTSAAAALASTLDAATAATLLGDGLANGGLTDDVMLALAQAAGVLDAAGAQGAPAGAPGSNALPLTLPVSSSAMPAPPPGFSSALLGPAGPAVFSSGPAAAGGQAGAAGLPGFAAGGGTSAATAAAVRAGLLGSGNLAGLAGLASPGPAGTWRSPTAATWRTAAAAALTGGLAGLGSPGPVAAGARTTQAAAALAPQGLLAGLASPPGPRGTGPKHNTLYKTEMCRSWTETGSCRYGSKCQFAHGPEELRPVIRHPKYKTEHCRTYAATGACQYGSRCRFIHSTPPGSAFGTPRPQGVGLLGPEVGGLMSPGMATPAGGGAALQAAADAAGAMPWSRTSDSGVGNGALPAAAASLLSPTKASLFSPASRGGVARPSNPLASPPFKMPRLGPDQLMPLMQLPPATANGAAGAAGSSGDAAANRAVTASLALLGGAGGMFGGNDAAGAGAGASGAADAALQLFSTFGRGGDPKAGAISPGGVTLMAVDQQREQQRRRSVDGGQGRQDVTMGGAAPSHGGKSDLEP